MKLDFYTHNNYLDNTINILSISQIKIISIADYPTSHWITQELQTYKRSLQTLDHILKKSNKVFNINNYSIAHNIYTNKIRNTSHCYHLQLLTILIFQMFA